MVLFLGLLFCADPAQVAIEKGSGGNGVAGVLTLVAGLGRLRRRRCRSDCRTGSWSFGGGRWWRHCRRLESVDWFGCRLVSWHACRLVVVGWSRGHVRLVGGWLGPVGDWLGLGTVGDWLHYWAVRDWLHHWGVGDWGIGGRAGNIWLGKRRCVRGWSGLWKVCGWLVIGRLAITYNRVVNMFS